MSLIVASTSAAPVTTLKQQDGHCPKFGSYFETDDATHIRRGYERFIT